MHPKGRSVVTLGCRLLAPCALLGACSIGPDFVAPQVSVPERYASAPVDEAARPAGGVESDTAAFEVSNAAHWWQTFGDTRLQSLLTQALQANLDLQIAESRIREARALISLERSDFFPHLTTLGSYSKSKTSENVAARSDGDGEAASSASEGTIRGLYHAGFDASWEIDIFGGTRRKVEAAQALWQASIEAQRDVTITLLAEVAQNYIVLRRAQKELELTQRNAAAEQETFELQKLKQKAGIANDLQVSQAEAQYQNTRAQIPLAETSVRKSMHRLGVLVGREPAALAQELAAPLPIPRGPSILPPGMPSELLQRRPDIRQAEQLLAAANANVGVAISDLFPKFNLTGSAGYKSNDSSSLFTSGSEFWSFGPSFSWQIFNWGAVLTNIQIQDERQQRALLQYKQTVLRALEEVENALVAYAQEQKRLSSLQVSVDAGRNALDMAQRLNQAGLSDFLNVLSTQQALNLSESQLAQSEGAVALNLIALYKALGGGWERTEQH